MTGDISMGDSVKAKFGASNDLQIYHGMSMFLHMDATHEKGHMGTTLMFSQDAIVNTMPYTEDICSVDALTNNVR